MVNKVYKNIFYNLENGGIFQKESGFGPALLPIIRKHLAQLLRASPKILLYKLIKENNSYLY